MAFGFTQKYEIKARPDELMWKEKVVLQKGKISFYVPTGYRARITVNGKNYILRSGSVYDAKQFGGSVDVFVVNVDNAQKSVKYGLSDILSLHIEAYPDLRIKHGISGEYRLTIRDDDLFFDTFRFGSDNLSKAVADDFRATVTEAVKNSTNKALASSDKTMHSFYPLIDGVKSEAIAEMNRQMKAKGLSVTAITINFNILPESEEVLKKVDGAELDKYLKLIKAAGEPKKEEPKPVNRVEKTQKTDETKKTDGGFCPVCGIRLAVNAKFCFECGADVNNPKEVKYCAGCGNKYGGKGNFCAFCGKKLK